MALLKLNFVKSKPTEKMIGYAAWLSELTGIPLPHGIFDDFDMCSKFINDTETFRTLQTLDEDDYMDDPLYWDEILNGNVDDEEW